MGFREIGQPGAEQRKPIASIGPLDRVRSGQRAIPGQRRRAARGGALEEILRHSGACDGP